MKKGYVYILSNKYRTTFYIGVTSQIKRRILEHKNGEGSEFTSKYNLTDLVYYEKIEGMDECIAREKQLKNWHRDWKINLIEVDNTKMVDLARDWYIMKDGVWLVRSSPLTDPETSSG